MRRHHEELSILPALSLLLPFAGALWLRIKTGRPKNTTDDAKPEREAGR
jgi:hypothetical protein